MRSKSAWLVSSVCPNVLAAAQCTSTCTGEPEPPISAAACCTSSITEISQRGWDAKSNPNTRAPSCVKRPAQALPMPLAAPVITVVLPDSRIERQFSDPLAQEDEFPQAFRRKRTRRMTDGGGAYHAGRLQIMLGRRHPKSRLETKTNQRQRVTKIRQASRLSPSWKASQMRT